jgi:replicative DNA helicase
MEKNIEKRLTEITSKIKKLKARNQRIEAENEELRKSVFGYLQLLETQKKDTAKASLSLQHEQLSQSLGGDKKALQKELDKYILMIDKCIAAVNAKI